MNESEAEIHFEFWRYLQAAIEANAERNSITFGRVAPEFSDDINGRADIVVFNDADDPIFVIEAKRPGNSGQRDIDPFSPRVIRQAFGYAGDIGAPYFCTYNRDRLVIFDAYEEGVPLLERSTKSYEIANVEEFADTLLNEIARLNAGTTDWDTLDTVFIDRVHSMHEQITPSVQQSLENHLEDGVFREEFIDWTAAQGIDFTDANDEERESILQEFSEQASYLLINKIIFYKILESAETYRDDVDPLAVSRYRVQEDLEEHFQHIVDDVDFEAIYDHDPIYSEIPLDPVTDQLRDFILELDEQDLTRFDSDVIGRIYEGVIPPDRRREMGEYYTPPAICDLITRLTISDAGDRVLDPACGSGGFLVSAYHRIRDLLPEPAGSHERILNQLSGVEINRFPAHLTTINLAIQDLSSYTHDVDVEIADFFNVVKNQRFERERASAEGGETESGLVEQTEEFDAIIANPPYIRQENIEEKDRVRDHLQSREIDADYVSRRSDIYTYFITHGTEFLAEGGDLGFIVSDRWLDTKYGEDLQQFLLDNFEIRAVVKFERQVFDDAVVDSSVLILRKQSEEQARDQNITKFIQLKTELDVDEIASLVEDDIEADQMLSNDRYRLVTRRQSSLYQQSKWNLPFIAPPIYFEISASPRAVVLEDVADVKYGLKTGANPFFCAHPEEWDELGILEHTTPILRKIGQTGNRIRLSQENADDWRVLHVHELVEQALEENEELTDDLADRVIRWLEENGYDALAEYLHWGKDEGYHERSTLSSRRVWFDLGELNAPPIFGMVFTWSEHRAVWNEIGALADDQFHWVTADEGVSSKLLAGILNSRVIWLMSELLSRRTGNPTMTRIQTKVYEYKSFPVPAPREMGQSERDRIIAAFEELMNREEEMDEDATQEEKETVRDALDKAVLATIGMEGRLNEVKEAVDELVKSRERGAGRHTEVLVERLRKTSETETIELPGVESARESARLSDF